MVVSFVILSLLVAVAYADVSLVNQYDPNGNLVSGDGKYYEYNDANQLVRVRSGDLNGAIIGEYFYDFSGQRVKKIENGLTTYYIGQHYETNVVSGVAANTSYFFADGERVAKKDSTGTYFYHPDHLGGVNAVTDSAKMIVAKTSYLPFGEIRQGGQDKYSYTGKEMDKATGQYYYDARYNSPGLRHFTQADAAEPDMTDPQDLNRYAYVGNNPLSYVDPDGHKKKHLSKREKWMKAHGANPDKDKTSLKKAKKLEKEGKKYVVAAKAAAPKAINAKSNLVVASTVKGNNSHVTTTENSGSGKVLGASTTANDSYCTEDEAPSKHVNMKVEYDFGPDVVSAICTPYGGLAVGLCEVVYQGSSRVSYFFFSNIGPATDNFINSIKAYRRSH